MYASSGRSCANRAPTPPSAVTSPGVLIATRTGVDVAEREHRAQPAKTTSETMITYALRDPKERRHCPARFTDYNT
jgi:hypothetical protein